MNRTLTGINFTLATMMLLFLAMTGGQVWSGFHPPAIAARLPEIGSRSFESGGGLEWDAVRAAVDANLFDPSRAPYSEPVAAVEPEPTKTVDPPNVKVSGTTISGETALAIVQAANEKKTRVVKPGETVSGYTVKEIKSGAVVFEKDGQLFTVEKTAGETSAGKAPASDAAPATIKMEGEKPKAAEAAPAAKAEQPKAEKGEKSPSYKNWNIPDGHELYMTPMGPTIRKIPEKPDPKIPAEEAARMMRGGNAQPPASKESGDKAKK